MATAYDMVHSARYMNLSSSLPSPFSCPIDRMGEQKSLELAQIIRSGLDCPIPIEMDSFHVRFCGLSRAAIWAANNGGLATTQLKSFNAHLTRLVQQLSAGPVTPMVKYIKLSNNLIESYLAEGATMEEIVQAAEHPQAAMNGISLILSEDNQQILYFHFRNIRI